ncbi:hypothetical protein AUJ68_02355 [Candidatus Woesearchaeota archaeon CG1_02_57_44]|nr:MAG: hypothetical protein AUJ68_02355 [Candidatus Woesearchaeota archaeon CG1_02_57_44]PIN69664.1 MAG: hypothetical protein COV94_02655 [Candidatus Woesearchaeota archaeon CG11_big_fil_rev_8_21_14_0_20_57_5]
MVVAFRQGRQDQDTIRRQAQACPRRIFIVKVGSGLVVDDDGAIRGGLLQSLSHQLIRMRAQGWQGILVCSGAVALGAQGARRAGMHNGDRAALAAIGQARMMHAFHATGIDAAQLLLTRQDIDRSTRVLHVLLRQLPIIVVNENDPVGSSFGNNDALAAELAVLMQARLLILLSTVPGLLVDGGPVCCVTGIDEELLAHVQGTTSVTGVGGMRAKLRAAQRAASCGAATVIADGRERDILRRILTGERVGTLLCLRHATGQERSKRDSEVIT